MGLRRWLPLGLAGGRDGGDASWKEAYCRVLVESSGNEEKARAETPYSIRQIQEFKSKTSTSYDEEFSTMLEEAWAKIAAPNQEAAFGAIHKLNTLDVDSEDSFYKAKTLETIHRVAIKNIEKLDPARYGNKLNVHGRVDHVHSQERYLPQGEIVARLMADRQAFLENRQKQGLKLIESGTPADPAGDRCLPVLPVKLHYLAAKAREIHAVEATHASRVQIGSGTRTSERVNAAYRAEVVLCRHRSELIGTEMLAAGQESEVLGWHAEVKDDFLRADGAVALRDAIDNGVDLESDATTVTTPGVARHLRVP